MKPTEGVQYIALVVGRPVGHRAEQVVILGRQSSSEQREEEHSTVAGLHGRVARRRLAEVADVVKATVSAGPRQRLRRRPTLG